MSAAKMKRSGDKKCRGDSSAEDEHKLVSRHSSSSKKEAAGRYEFEGKFPKGYRTEREKRKSDGKKDKAEKSPAVSPQKDKSGKEHQKHLKKLRTVRAIRSEASSKKVLNAETKNVGLEVDDAQARVLEQGSGPGKDESEVSTRNVDVPETGKTDREEGEVEAHSDFAAQHENEGKENKENDDKQANREKDEYDEKTTIPISEVEAAVVEAREENSGNAEILYDKGTGLTVKVEKGQQMSSSDMENRQEGKGASIENNVEQPMAGTSHDIVVTEGQISMLGNEKDVEIKEEVNRCLAVENESDTQTKENEHESVGVGFHQEIQEPQKLENAEPDTSLSLGLSGSRRAPSNKAKSFQSISQAETFSNAVTTSLSLSCSHPLMHNPSCSLTQTSHDNQEFSSATQPMCQETNEQSHGSWRMSAGENISRGGLHHGKKRDFEDYSRHQGLGQGSKGRAFSQPAGSRQNSQHPQPKGSLHKKHAKSTGLSQSAGSCERWNDHREMDIFDGEKAPQPLSSVYGGVSLREVVSNAVPIVAHKMKNLQDNVLNDLKVSAKDLLECADKREEFFQLQRILQNRTDLSAEVLLSCHRTQLEVLVALKTGIQAFLLQENPLQSSVLIEVFLHSKCRNIHCQSQLPVDDCECQMCSQKNGFCNACMCVVCSKFDFDANTCRWVGCDYCLHWCHTDCGIRKSYIRPGPSIRGAAGTSEMQFHCIACECKSELFGFVKEVFTTCAREWSREVLARELDCARRMFYGSEDVRGKQLCWKAEQLLGKLESNADVAEACNSILRFFEESVNLQNKALQHLEDENHGTTSAPIAKPYGSDPAAVLERATLALKAYDRVLDEKRTDAAEIQYERARKKAEIEELESIIRIKQAEAQMFQARADEASREAEGLRRIVLAKCLKLEDEYTCKISKLQLLEAEEKRKRKFEDLQLLQRGSDNLEILKSMMGDLKDLLRNMEAAKHPKSEELPLGIEAYIQRYSQSR